MLTVKQINEVSFGKAGFSGYKPEDVDNFIDEVVSSFQQLEAERDDALKKAQELAAQNAELTAKNAETTEKLAILAQKIESYREEEDGIKDAILSAQKLAKDSVREAKDKAAIILQDAKDSAQQLMDNAKVDASKAAKEYMAQAEEKKEELEEIKRQVSAFRSSLMEMYKKHLECIDHIPVFRQKEKAEPVEEAEESVEPEPAPVVSQPAPKPVFKPDPEPVEKAPQPAPAPAPRQPAEQARPEAEQPARTVSQQPRRRPFEVLPSDRPARTLHDRVDYSRETGDLPEEDDLSDVGIDLRTYSDIPETLRREKDSHFSNLEFGDDVDLGNKKRKK